MSNLAGIAQRILCGIVFFLVARHGTAEAPTLEERKAAWLEKLENETFEFPEHYNGLIESLSRYYADDVKIHVIFDPKTRYSMEFKFTRDEKDILSIRGHANSAFTAHANTLFFAHYHDDAAGCTVRAYDISSGNILWETTLHHEKPGGHSGYSNVVMMWTAPERGLKGESAIVVTGMESYCDYVEVLDSQTGESLAIKNYRVGFVSPAKPSDDNAVDDQETSKSQR